MNRRFLFIIALCLYPFLLQAAPFARQIAFTQPDGTPLTLRGRGDEFYAEFETLDGYSVVFDPTSKAYVYARLSADGSTLESSGGQVGQVNPATLNLKKHLKIHSLARKAQTEKRYQQWDSALRVSERWKARKQKLQEILLLAAPGTGKPSSDGTVIQAPPATSTTGTKVGLTLLVDFSDEPGTISQSNVVSFCNGTNYTGYGNNGSVKQYFYDNSKGLLTYTNVVTAYIRVPHPKSYYNDTALSCATQGRLLVTDALNAMKALPNYATTILPLFNGLSEDSWHDVVACNVFFAGSDSGVWDQGLWPNSYALAASLSLGNGKSVYSYQITDIGTSLEIGTFCHENGHMLCDYPDIYDYDNSSEGGAGVFCLMNSGGHGGNPSQICAYLKRASGWATTVELTSSSSLTGMVGSAGTNFNKFYRYAKPGVPTEYFLIENRQPEGRDADQLPGGGLAVWHIDELGDHNNESLAPNSSHANYEVTLVQADNLWHFENNAGGGDANDLYYRGNTATAYSGIFDDYASPAATWWNGSASGLSLWNFSVKATNMTFTIGYPLPRPAANSMSVVGESALPFNNAIDPGETVSVAFSLRNLGGSPTTNLTATLLPGGGVTAPSGAMAFGVLRSSPDLKLSL
ncbi:MAG: M6 family metalloprotease domain-containing protein [bacterium]